MIIEAPHLFEMIVYSYEDQENKTYHSTIKDELNSRFAKQRAAFLKEFLWYYNSTKVEFLCEENVRIFEWLTFIGVKFS